MSNYQVEPANKPQALTKEAIKAVRHEQVQGVSRRELLRGSLAAAHGPLARSRSPPARSASCGRTSQGKFGGQVKIGDATTTSRPPTPRCPIDEGFPAYVLVREGVRHPRRPVPAAVHPGRGRDRRRHRPSTSARCTSAARTSAASPTRA